MKQLLVDFVLVSLTAQKIFDVGVLLGGLNDRSVSSLSGIFASAPRLITPDLADATGPGIGANTREHLIAVLISRAGAPAAGTVFIRIESEGADPGCLLTGFDDGESLRAQI